MSILEELMRGGESRSDPMDDDRGGAEERRRGGEEDQRDRTRRGGGRQAQATSQAGDTFIVRRATHL